MEHETIVFSFGGALQKTPTGYQLYIGNHDVLTDQHAIAEITQGMQRLKELEAEEKHDARIKRVADALQTKQTMLKNCIDKICTLKAEYEDCNRDKETLLNEIKSLEYTLNLLKNG